MTLLCSREKSLLALSFLHPPPLPLLSGAISRASKRAPPAMSSEESGKTIAGDNCSIKLGARAHFEVGPSSHLALPSALPTDCPLAPPGRKMAHSSIGLPPAVRRLGKRPLTWLECTFELQIAFDSPTGVVALVCCVLRALCTLLGVCSGVLLGP